MTTDATNRAPYQARGIEWKEPNLDNLNEVRSKQQCNFCGGSYPHSKGESGKRNDFAKVCVSTQHQFPSEKSKKREQNNKKRHVNPLKTQMDSDSSSKDYLYVVNNNKTPKVLMKVCKPARNSKVRIQVPLEPTNFLLVVAV